MDNNNLTDYIQRAISHWVGRNYGSQEVEDPSWNIEDLSAFVAKEILKREERTKNLVGHELTVLLPVDCNENTAIEKVRETIKRFGGEIVKEENDGKKRLAYKINGKEWAIYYYLDIMIPKDSPAKISGVLNIDDDVLRYLLVRKDTRR